jgi:endonuclease YncB( thermonuclease family)
MTFTAFPRVFTLLSLQLDQRENTVKFKCLVCAIVAATIAALSVAGVTVRDAGAIVVDRKPVRLNGVDAPELNTRAEQDGKRWMISYLNGKNVTCDLTDKKTYDRWVGVYYADGEDVGAAVVGAGFALDCAKFSGGVFSKFETPAAKSRLRRAKYC